MFGRPASFSAVIADGQVCFYGIAILAAAWYDLRDLAEFMPIASMQSCIFLVGAIAASLYGVLASDHLGARMVSVGRAAVVSIVIGLASISLALIVHSKVVLAH